jgi:hypothetical protein
MSVASVRHAREAGEENLIQIYSDFFFEIEFMYSALIGLKMGNVIAQVSTWFGYFDYLYF